MIVNWTSPTRATVSGECQLMITRTSSGYWQQQCVLMFNVVFWADDWPSGKWSIAHVLSHFCSIVNLQQYVTFSVQDKITCIRLWWEISQQLFPFQVKGKASSLKKNTVTLLLLTSGHTSINITIKLVCTWWRHVDHIWSKQLVSVSLEVNDAGKIDGRWSTHPVSSALNDGWQYVSIRTWLLYYTVYSTLVRFDTYCHPSVISFNVSYVADADTYFVVECLHYLLQHVSSSS